MSPRLTHRPSARLAARFGRAGPQYASDAGVLAEGLLLNVPAIAASLGRKVAAQDQPIHLGPRKLQSPCCLRHCYHLCCS